MSVVSRYCARKALVQVHKTWTKFQQTEHLNFNFQLNAFPKVRSNKKQGQRF